MITHHPNDALLLDYASGAASEPISLLVATHLALCPCCRRKVAEYEAIGGALVNDCESEKISCELKSETLSVLDNFSEVEISHDTSTSKRPADTKAGIPQPLSGYCGDADSKDMWQWAGFGIKKIPLLESHDNFECYMLAIRGGKKVPSHDHGGSEWTLVLDGAFTDEAGHFSRGDMVEMREGEEHQPIADAGKDCICLVVAEAPVSLTGSVGRLLNPFIGR